jgi:cell wall-associated NlpC family hydrolase
MSKLDEFINYLEQEAANHSIYVWGAQGQTHPTITESWIRCRENSTKNADRAIRYWKAQCAAGYQFKLKAFDCSGLGIWTLQQLKIIKNDMSAAGLYGKCTKINKNSLRRGDWVFIHNGTKISHIGYVVDDELNTIEAYGRDLGVVKRKLSHGKWNRFGRPQYFENESGSSALTK